MKHLKRRALPALLALTLLLGTGAALASGGSRFTSIGLGTAYPEEFYYTYSWYGNPDDPELDEVRRVDYRELAGAVEMTGYVFIPV